MISGLIARARSLWRAMRTSARVDAEIVEEFRLHIALRAEDLVRQGSTPEKARRQARLEFGSTAGYRDEARRARGLGPFDGLRMSWLDIKLGIRMLVKYPAVTLVGGLATAFAIAAGAAAFELVTAVIHPVLPLPEGDRIVGIRTWDRDAHAMERRLAHALTIWRDELKTVEQLGATRFLERNLSIEGRGARPIRLAAVTSSAFAMAATPPILGRPLLAADEAPAAAPVVVIGERVWHDRFGGDAEVVGRTVRLDDEPATVVGVMPERFGFPLNHRLWVPLRLDPHPPPRSGPEIRVFGRLAAGVDLAAANAELALLDKRLAQAQPDTHGSLHTEALAYGIALMGVRPDMAFWAGAYSIHLVAIAFLLLVCANVGALVLARTATRDGEIALRNALGGSRRRIIMQLVAEALVLQAAAAAVGLAAARWGLHWGFAVFETVNGPLPFWIRPRLTPATFGYTAGLVVVGAVLVGVLPALRMTRGMAPRLRKAAAGVTHAPFGRPVTAVIAVQVAFTVFCLPVAFHFTADAETIESIDIGLPAAAYLTAELALDVEAPANVPADRVEAARRDRFTRAFRELDGRLRAEPAVEAVTYAGQLPGAFHPRHRIELDDAATEVAIDQRVQVASVDPAFFDELERAPLAGRGMHAGDPAADVVMVNQAFVDEVLGGSRAVGRRLRLTDPRRRPRPNGEEPPTEPWLEIVGIAPDLALNVDPDLRHGAGIYRPVAPTELTPVRLAIRLHDDPARFAPRLRALAIAADPALRIDRIRTLDQIRSELVVTYVFWLRVLMLGTGFALVLSLAGIYALMAFAVTRQRREIGIRVALGASRLGVVWGTLRRAFRPAAWGVSAGLAGLIVLAGGVPTGAIAQRIAAGIGLVVLGVVVASLVPARRVLRVEPSDALRTE